MMGGVSTHLYTRRGVQLQELNGNRAIFYAATIGMSIAPNYREFERQ